MQLQPCCHKKVNKLFPPAVFQWQTISRRTQFQIPEDCLHRSVNDRGAVSPALPPMAALTVSDYYSDAPVDCIKKALEASCHFSLECFLSESRKGSSVSSPTCRGPASMPPRRATATMHNHAAAVSLSGTRGCTITPAFTFLGILFRIKKAELPFVLYSLVPGTVRSSWANRKWTIIKHQLQKVNPLRWWMWVQSWVW